LTIRHRLTLHPHYFAMLFPAPFLLIGAATQWTMFRVLGRAILGAAAVTVVVSVIAIIGLLTNLATGYEPCFGAPMRVTKTTAAELVEFATMSGSSHVAMEVGEADDVALTYLVRPSFPTLEVAGMGPFGLGQARPGGSLPSPAGTLRDAAQRLDLTYPGGIHVGRATFVDDPLQGGRVRLALDWSVDESAARSRPLVWDVALYDANGRRVVAPERSGLDHVPTELRGQHIISWFSIDTPRDLGPGPHREQVRLIDADTSTPLPFTGPDGSQDQAWLTGPLDIHPTPRCFAN
jgi:hypothetical protein